jgi:hypothetical protein
MRFCCSFRIFAETRNMTIGEGKRWERKRPFSARVHGYPSASPRHCCARELKDVSFVREAEVRYDREYLVIIDPTTSTATTSGSYELAMHRCINQ